jgi:hypothetical protein
VIPEDLANISFGEKAAGNQPATRLRNIAGSFANTGGAYNTPAKEMDLKFLLSGS